MGEGGGGFNVLTCCASIRRYRRKLQLIFACVIKRLTNPQLVDSKNSPKTCPASAREHSSSCTIQISNPDSIVLMNFACFLSPSRPSFDYTLPLILHGYYDRSSKKWSPVETSCIHLHGRIVSRRWRQDPMFQHTTVNRHTIIRL